MQAQAASISDLEAHSFPASVNSATRDRLGSKEAEAELAEMEREERARRADQAAEAGVDLSI